MTAFAGIPSPPLRDRAADAATRLRISGSRARTWLDAGRPVRATERFRPASCHGIIEYVPGDLTLTARAGTTLAEIRDATAEHGQWLALDPFRPTSARSAPRSPRRPRARSRSPFGAPRDVVLGLEFVTGDGDVVRGGGRVVKNVAGFDLMRLLTGAWGTLGVITEVSVRLRARPEADETVALSVRDDSEPALRALLTRVQGVKAAPWALELLSPALAERLGVAAHAALVARLAGNGDSVRAQRAAFATLGTLMDLPSDVWDAPPRLRAPVRAVVRIRRAARA